MRYLDPKADLTFKRVFGEHPDLVMSLLNALLPLNEGEEITDIEYLSSELVPENPLRKNSIVDVRCKDKQGRQFIVEMQMIWSPEFKQRVLFNASKAYVRQIDSGEQYELLQPVYSLNLVNEVFESDLEGYYHYYKLVHVEHTDKVIEGLHLIFVELPKFTPQTYAAKKMHVLWLRYLTEISQKTYEVSQELLENPQIKKALNTLEVSAFTENQLLEYEKFWDIISVEKTLYNSAERRGMKKGMEEGIKEGMEIGREIGMEIGREEGREEGHEEGRKEGIEIGAKNQNIANARNLKQLGVPIDIIIKATGLSIEDIENLPNF
ncbi:Rpn family recombination-promoting nuclease/putative transposase [Bacteroides sp. 519]|uniref:Rpn family recombination-promoting nuclease/putative transposase n=1 Tax=Bacteroides sp. 519 TaxID=2302937 RepID=UPI0013D646D1|nr:Rpn family recombination-promoting nuclease/putative transposase [Bacteroides sp. 519]NDV60617.1 Rpn family recombination-promoting nuclease/putative transposase [Bacteroides sp. 519]